MTRNFISNIISVLAFALFSISAFAAESVKVLEFDLTGEISSPQFQIVKRALKTAQDAGIETVVVNMNTPGGDLETTLKIMEALSEFKGLKICYVNPNAGSAGSYIAVCCDEIWFAPRAVMGAAEAISSDGSDVGKALKRKLDSFLSAKVKAITENSKNPNPNIANVQRAMANPDIELVLDGKTIKKSGELLSLTAQDAVKKYGGFPLLANGIADNSKSVLKGVYPKAKEIEIQKFELSAFEKFAKYISAFSPILMGIGVFLLILEFKTAGFGVFGILGIGILALVFLGVNAAGLAGYEAPIIFAAGIVMLILELFVFTGFFICGVLGILLVAISLVMTGAAPIPESGFTNIVDALAIGVGKFAIAVIIAFALLYLLKPILKTTPLWKKFVLEGGQKNELENLSDNGLIGKEGVVISELVPNGKVKIDENIYDASAVDGGFVGSASKVEVVKVESFGLKVKKL